MQLLMTPISSTEPGKPFCSCFKRQPAWLKKTANTHWKWHRSFRISFARLKIGSRELRGGEVQLYRDKADRAEQWLHKVCTEIEERFIRQAEEKRRVSSLNAAGREQRRSTRPFPAYSRSMDGILAELPWGTRPAHMAMKEQEWEQQQQNRGGKITGR